MSDWKIEPTWPRGMYGCPQDMYGASVVLPLKAALETAEAENADLRGDYMDVLGERDRLQAQIDAVKAHLEAYKHGKEATGPHIIERILSTTEEES